MTHPSQATLAEARGVHCSRCGFASNPTATTCVVYGNLLTQGTESAEQPQLPLRPLSGIGGHTKRAAIIFGSAALVSLLFWSGVSGDAQRGAAAERVAESAGQQAVLSSRATQERATIAAVESEASARQAEPYLRAASEYREEGELGLALAEIEQLLALQPNLPTAMQLRSQVSAEATAVVQRVASDEYLQAANDYRAAGQLGLALLSAQQAIAMNPNESVARDLLARLQVQATAEVQEANARATAAALPPAEITSYMEYMAPKMAVIAESVGRLGDLSSRVANNPSLLFDQNWRVQTATVLFLLKVSGQEIPKYQPVPAELRTLDNLLVSVGRDLVYIVDQYTLGVDNLSSANINNATRRMQSMTATLQRAQNELNAISRRYGR